MPGTKEAAESIIQSSMENAIKLALLGAHDAALYFLGSGLHTLQDRYSHYEQDCDWPQGHRKKKCDDPLLHPCEYSRALDASKRYIEEFVKRTQIR